MSVWTHIQGVFHIDLLNGYEDKAMLEMKARILLEQAPKITGSEGNIDIYINAENGYNSSQLSTWEDKYGKIHRREEDYQSVVIVTIIGDLRDRMINETLNEYKEFEAYLKNLDIQIRDYVVQVYDELGNFEIISNMN